ncbi:hypothetical protein GY45DRAFT_1368392 [Cubamyces sp. BRFM 1775]|nr:hypothetical protein GY45DRAFT_1368392 [Cubamyces sp. BRFM 1775]
MAPIQKTISITADNLDQEVNLMMAFVPSTVDYETVVPIAWQVFSLTGTDSQSWTWNNVSAGCRAIIDPNTANVTSREFQQINVGRTSNMTQDKSVRPPVYKFSAPTTYTGKNARVVNQSGAYADIGAGFVTDSGNTFNTVLVNRRVAHTAAAFVDYDPVLTIWATADYAEDQLLDSDVVAIPTLWTGNLSKMTGAQVRLGVSRDKDTGAITIKLQGQGQAPPSAFQVSAAPATVYKVDLAFASPGLVANGVRDIAKLLTSKGYSLKATSKGFDTEAHIELRLPQKVSCNEAELAVIAAIDANQTVYGKAFIKGHSGAALLSAETSFESWIDINSASPQWFGISTKDGPSDAFNGTNGDAFAEANPEESADDAGDNVEDDEEPEPEVVAPVKAKGNGKFGSVRGGSRRGIPSDFM